MDIKNEKVENYLNDICNRIKNKRAHKEIRDELKSHIEGLFKYYIKEGNPKEKAVDLAIENLGESKKLGEKLNEIHKGKIDFKILFITLLLLFTGFIGTFTFSNGYKSIFQNQYIIRDSVFMVLSLLAFIIGSKVNFIKLKVFFQKIYIPIVLFLIFLFFERTLSGRIGEFLGIINIILMVPIVPMVILFSLSSIYEKLDFNNYKNKIKAILLGGVPFILILFSFKSMAMGIYYGVALAIIIFINSKSKKLTAFIIASELATFLILFILGFRSIERIMRFERLGYNFTELKTEHFIGGQRFYYFNNAYSIDNIIGRYGWIAGIIVIIAFLYLIFRINKASSDINNNYGKSLAFIIASVISVEIIWGILMNLNIVPYDGFPSFIISFRSIDLIFSLFILGFFNNIYKMKNSSKL